MINYNNNYFSLSNLLVSILATALIFMTSACSSAITEPGQVIPGNSGAVDISINFGLLGLNSNSSESGSRALVTITNVTVTLSRQGYSNIEANLPVTNNIAKGTVSDLEAGYWHVLATISDATSTLFTGEADVNVIAGSSVPCVLMFDPVTTEPTTGSVDFIVGMNPLPGYKALGFAAPTILVAPTNVYILDTAAKVVAVYTESMVRTKDIHLTESPTAVTLNSTKDALLLGYPNGTIYSLNLTTGAQVKVADTLMNVRDLVAVSNRFILAVGPKLVSVDLSTGQLVTTNSYWNNLTSFSFNSNTSTVYALDTGVSPSDIHRIRMNLTTGAITAVSDSIYHGDYYFGSPLRTFKNGTRLITSSGTMFNATTIDSSDLIYAGSIGTAYIDLAYDSTLNRTYILSNTTIKKLLILDGTTDFTLQTFELSGAPKLVFVTNQKVIVFVVSNGEYYSKVYTKEDLL